MDAFVLGRLSYELSELPLDYHKNGYIYPKGEKIFSLHIPSSKPFGPLNKDARLASYKKAYNFFSDKLNGKPMVIYCSSWLLYLPNKLFYPKKSNILDFMNDFDIVYSENTEFYDKWRVFGKDYTKPLNELPCETSLQNAFVDWLKAGNQVGCGSGILLFDGDNIIV